MPPPPQNGSSGSGARGAGPMLRGNSSFRNGNNSSSSATQIHATVDYDADLTQGTFAGSQVGVASVRPPGISGGGATTTTAVAAAKPRIHIPQEQIDSDIKMAQEGKVTVKNAWDMKIIESMPQAVESALGAGVAQLLEAAASTRAAASSEGDEYATFSRMANVVESGAKVWTHRVDNTYQLSMQMVRRVLRAEASGKDAEDGEDGEGEAGADTADANRKAAAARRRKAAAVRTIADSVDEINIEKKGASTTAEKVSETISPLFRAITKRYDQGHASGLLLHNAPLGLVNNLVIDVDYSLPQYRYINEKMMARQQRGGNNRRSAAAATATADAGAFTGNDQLDAGIEVLNGGAQRRAVAEEDAADAYLADVAQICQLQVKLEAEAAAASGQHRALQSRHSTAPQTDLTEFLARNTANHLDGTTPTRPSSSNALLGAVTEANPNERGASALFNDNGDEDYDGYGDNGDWGGADDGDDHGGDAGGDNGVKAEDVEDPRRREGSSKRPSIDPRALASGAHELAFGSSSSKLEPLHDEFGLGDDSGFYGGASAYGSDAFDRIGGGSMRGSTLSGPFGGVNDASWIAFSQANSDNLAKRRNGALLPFNSSLSRIRSQCATNIGKQSQSQAQTGTATTAATTRKAASKTVAFVEVDELIDEDTIRERLKSNPTNATALTPIGKEVLGYAPSSVTLQAYGDAYHMCEERAVLHRLVTPQLKESDLPSWMPLDALNVRYFYQPSCTDCAAWGALRKTRHNQQLPLGAITGAPRRQVNSTDDENNEGGGGDDGDFVAEMPIDVFADDDDFGDDNDGPDGDDDDVMGRLSGGANPFTFAALPTALDGLAAAGGDPAFDRFSGALGGNDGEEGRLSLIEGPQMLNVLSVRHATTPTQVDVVRLRQCMWDRVLRLSGGKEVLHVMGRLHQAEQDQLNLRLDRSRNLLSRGAACDGDDEHDTEKFYPVELVEADMRMVLESTGGAPTSAPRPGQKRTRADDEGRLIGLAVGSPLVRSVPRRVLFSDIVTGMLPDTPMFSKNGTLSPAFFFFAILFLANEHRILLHNHPTDLGDLEILGIAGAVNIPTLRSDE